MPVQWGTNPAVSQSVFLLRGLHAARPAAAPANQDYYYLETDTAGGTLFQSTGAAWVQVAGPVTDTDVNTFAGLTDVDMTGVTSGQLPAFNSGTGKYQPSTHPLYPALTNGGAFGQPGVNLDGSLNADFHDAAVALYHEVRGNLDLTGTQAEYLDGASPLTIEQGAVLDGVHVLGFIANLVRSVDRTLGVPTQAAVIITTQASAGPDPLAGEPVLQISGIANCTVTADGSVQSDGNVVAIKTLAAHGGLGLFTVTPPVSQPVGGDATAAGTYGATEQTMLQKAYDTLRGMGALS